MRKNVQEEKEKSIQKVDKQTNKKVSKKLLYINTVICKLCFKNYYFILRVQTEGRNYDDIRFS